MKKRSYLNLRIKLIIAFLLVSVIPLFIVMGFASYHGTRLQKAMIDFQIHDKTLNASLAEYDRLRFRATFLAASEVVVCINSRSTGST